MGIVDEDIARVRAATDFVALANEHMALKRVGRQYTGLCPFHGEKSPSFSLNPETGVYYCFGCQASGDVITFVRELDNLDFVGAVEALAGRAGITLHYDDDATGGGKDRQRRTRIQETLAAALAWYHERLRYAPDAAPARAYLRRERGYDSDVVVQYQLGWAPEGWSELIRSLKLSPAALADAGLAYVNDRGSYTDFFRGRLLFPIFDPNGRPLGAGGRMLPGGRPPKYKNTANTAVYDKSRTLYGLNWAKKAVVSTGQVVVCEGYTDVIGLFGVGVERAVATCGTALAEEHVKLLRGFASRVVLAFDADGAGQSAAGRFYEWERALEINVAVAALPPGSDPGELARTDPDALRTAIGGAKPFLQFRVERILDAAELSTPEGRAKAADATLAAVAEHPDNLVRDQYLMQVAERCRLDPGLLRPRLEELRVEGRRRVPSSGSGQPGRGSAGSTRRPRPAEAGADEDPWIREPDDGWEPDAADDGRDSGWSRTTGPAPGGRRSTGPVAREFRPGLEALRLAIHRPDDVSDRLEPALFRDPLQRATFQALWDADDLHQAIDGASPEVRALLVRLTVEEPTGEPDEVVMQLVREAARRELTVITAEARTSPSAVAEAADAARWVQELDDPTASATASARLVAWLVVRSTTEGPVQGP